MTGRTDVLTRAGDTDREVKMGSYSANSLSYILLKNNNTTKLGGAV